MKDEHDLTEGNITKTVILFSLPFLLANFIQAMYGAVDLLVIGWCCPPEAIAAVSTGTQVTQIITSMISGLTLGATVTVGTYMGKKQPEEAKRAISASLCLFLAAGLILTVLLLSCADWLLLALQTPEDAFSLAGVYVRTCGMGVIFICGYNAISAILRGYGDSKSPLAFIAVAGCLNVAGDVLLVRFLGLGVRGAALATVLSQGMSMAGSILYLNRRDFLFRFRLSNLRPYPDKVKELLRVGIPISLQECMVRLSFLYLTAKTNALGVSAAAAVGIASKYDVLAMLPANSAASALSPVVAQNYGAGKYRRMDQALVTAVLAALPFSLAFFLWAQVSPESMIRLFSQDAAVIAEGAPFFRACSYDYLGVLFMFCLNGYLNGRGKTYFTMVSCCFGALALRMPLIAIVCDRFPGNLGLIGTVAPAVSAFISLYTGAYVWKLARADRRGARA